jgi:hypothetical protein
VEDAGPSGPGQGKDVGSGLTKPEKSGQRRGIADYDRVHNVVCSFVRKYSFSRILRLPILSIVASAFMECFAVRNAIGLVWERLGKV